ncbi:hypothetical protein D9M68_871180 [compost metagenome]
MGGKVPRDIAAELADLSVQAVAYGFQLNHSASLDAILAFESQGKADIHQLQHRKVPDGVLRQLFEQDEEFLAAGGLVVKAAQQADL